MSTFQHRYTDAELAAQWSAQALQEGRLELGLAIARIAVQAARLEAGVTAVPMLGATRDEQPARPAEQVNPPTYQTAITNTVNRALYAVPTGPTGDGDADIEREAVNTGPPPARCRARVERDGVNDVCGQAAFWSSTGWHHVDISIDHHHRPAFDE